MENKVTPAVGRNDVSVLIAAFNASPFLERAVSSAMNQGSSVLEIIVVDDCSTDATLDIARRIAKQDERVKVVHLSKNVGPSGARNAGLHVARGDWVAVLDADDAYAPGRLERLIQTGASEKADIVADNFAFYDPTSGTSGSSAAALTSEITPVSTEAFLIHARPFGPDIDWGLLKPAFRRQFLIDRSLRYPEDSRHGEDFLLVMGALLAGAKYVVANFPGYLYTHRGSGWSRTQINYDGQVKQSSKLLLDPRVANDRKLVHLLNARIRSIKRLSAERSTQSLIKDRRPFRLLAAATTDWRIALSVLRKFKNKAASVRIG
ncbi:glycosyltransferase family 2 protein [Mesorhizobium sp. B3-2-1]|uniref:glycosyltransferase family 2 protein n=1 Tax=Mesorhizobium sp. B3-2-1 TaxID=2589891 RepID=UPI0015E3BF18|nr:glycosyltransferase family 2 protein [Mesorhizobium sp. B3-2-1]